MLELLACLSFGRSLFGRRLRRRLGGALTLRLGEAHLVKKETLRLRHLQVRVGVILEGSLGPRQSGDVRRLHADTWQRIASERAKKSESGAG